MTEGAVKIVCKNKRAFHNYFIEELYEAGVVLTGTEVKSLREGTASLRDSYAVFTGNELFLLNTHIPHYKFGNQLNHEPLRTRKLLLRRSQLEKLAGKTNIRGYALVPLKIYFKKGMAKVEIGVAKGKKAFDKRATEKERDAKREMAQVMKRNR